MTSWWRNWRQQRQQLTVVLLGLLLAIGLHLQLPVMGHTSREILWDTWGVPHIYSPSQAGLFHAFGYAQMQSHGKLLLRLYGQARGRAAQYWGAQFLSSDQYVHRMGIPSRAEWWYQAQQPDIRQFIDAFAAGVNDYARVHPAALSDDLKTVLPITGVDVLAHVQRTMYFHFVFNPQLNAPLLNAPQLQSALVDQLRAGSNGWAIAPSHSRTGNALLLANPHLPWQDLFLFYEAHLNGPNCHLYGAALVGMPVLAIAFNDALGWTTTVNTHQGWTAYQLTLQDGGYLWDGEVRPLATETIMLQVKQPDGTLTAEPLIVEHSIHGPVLRQGNGQAIALRIAGLERADVVAQFWQMGLARDRAEFESALSQLQMPMFNFLYADRAGEILYVFNALIPKRRNGDWYSWTKPVAGDTTATLWDAEHSYRELPRLVNPQTGWLQNSNEPPWSSTWPPQLDATDYPAYFAPPNLGDAPNLFRTQRSLKLLLGQDQWSMPALIAAHADTHLELAERVAPELAALALGSEQPLLQAAGKVLQAWDGRATAESGGTALFALWWASLPPGQQWQTPWQPEDALNTPHGIADPDQALAVLATVAKKLRDRYGRLDVPWGEMVRMRVGDHNLPAQGASGALGSFPVLDAIPNENLEFTVVFGESYTAAIEFSDPIQAQAVQPYGNATQPDSAHRGDQLSLYLSGQMRPVWRDRATIEANLESQVELAEWN